jgi:hypothetical protein
MAFSENQLSTWSNQGATISAASTYNSIKTCLDAIDWEKKLGEVIKYEIYLQGSYRNATNIRGNSDVDIVLEFTSVFYSNKRSLPADQLREFDEFFSDGKYSLQQFKDVVIMELQNYYGKGNIDVSNRAIKIAGANGRLNADVVCCATYREYRSFAKNNLSNYAEGITFWEKNTGNQVINFPKLHYNNGAAKNQTSTMNYKPSTRIIKNMKSRIVDAGTIDAALAPSYFIEGLLYNLSNDCFNKTTHEARTISILEALGAATRENTLSQYVCQNGQRYLFGVSDQQWNEDDCRQFIHHLINFWNAG